MRDVGAADTRRAVRASPEERVVWMLFNTPPQVSAELADAETGIEVFK